MFATNRQVIQPSTVCLATSAEWTLNTWLYFLAEQCLSPGQTPISWKMGPQIGIVFEPCAGRRSSVPNIMVVRT